MAKALKKKKRGKGFVLWLIIAAAWVFVIWGNSLKPGAVSAKMSDAALKILQSLIDGVGINYTLTSFVVRKLAHFSEFFLLGIFLYHIGKHGGIPLLLIMLSVGICIAAMDEGIQLFVDGRTAMVSDILIDTAGVLGGLTLCVLFRVLFVRD